MSRKYTELTFTPSVKAAQEHYGARASAKRVEEWAIDDARLSADEQAFVAERDGFYMASVGENGWPYVQFRGGPVGFVKVLDEATLAYADFRGNRQYISTGNLRHDGRVALFFMDYEHQRRLKVMARAEIVDVSDAPDLRAKLEDPTYRARVERLVVFRVAAFDWNCPQHIPRRHTVPHTR